MTLDEARQVLTDMRAAPKPLARPLVILGGMNDPGFAANALQADFRDVTGDERVLGVSFMLCGDFDTCRERVIKAVDAAFPSDDPTFTTEVDAIGVSMGGLVARYAAAPSGNAAPSRRLRIARLFTISTPHRGAALAALPTFSRLHLAMRSESPFLRSLRDAEAAAAAAEGAYEIYPYVRLGDVMVGAWNTAPHGRSPWWVSGQPLQTAHAMASRDKRILADVARRLRGEAPLTSDPPEPLPASDLGPTASDPGPTARSPQQACRTAPSGGTTFAFHQAERDGASVARDEDYGSGAAGPLPRTADGGCHEMVETVANRRALRPRDRL